MAFKTVNVEEDVWEMLDRISKETGIPKKTLIRSFVEYVVSSEDALWEIMKKRDKRKPVKEREVNEEKEVNSNPVIRSSNPDSRKIKI